MSNCAHAPARAPPSRGATSATRVSSPRGPPRDSNLRSRRRRRPGCRPSSILHAGAGAGAFGDGECGSRSSRPARRIRDVPDLRALERGTPAARARPRARRTSGQQPPVDDEVQWPSPRRRSPAPRARAASCPPPRPGERARADQHQHRQPDHEQPERPADRRAAVTPGAVRPTGLGATPTPRLAIRQPRDRRAHEVARRSRAAVSPDSANVHHQPARSQEHQARRRASRARSTATATLTGPLRSRAASNARSASPRMVARSVSPHPSGWCAPAA